MSEQNDAYERDAERFYRETGYMAPGKDQPMGAPDGLDDTIRMLAWRGFLRGTPDGERIEGWLDCSHDDLPGKWEPQTWARFSAGNPLRDSVPATLIIHGEPSRESEPERRTLEEWAEWFDNPNESPTFAVRDIRQNQSEMHTPGYLMRRIIEDLPESGREESDA